MGCLCSLISANETDYKVVSNFDFLNNINSKLEPLINKDKKFRKDIVNCVTPSGTNLLSYICENQIELLSLLIKHKMINKKALLYTDNDGKNFMHYLLTNPKTPTSSIQSLKKYKIFNSVKNIIFKNYDNMGNTPLISCTISGNFHLLQNVLPITDKMRWFDKNRNENSVFTLSVTNDCNDLVTYMLNCTSDISGIVRNIKIGKYSDILEYSLYNNQMMALSILISLHYELLKYKVYTYKDQDGDTVYGNHFNLACIQNKKEYVSLCCQKGLIDKYDFQHNFWYISKVINSRTLVDLINKELIPYESIYIRDSYGNTSIAWSLQNNTDLYKIYFQRNKIDERIASIRNNYGDNLVTLAAVYDVNILMYLFNAYNKNIKMMFNVNNDGEDFVDILMESAKVANDYPYIYNIINVDTDYKIKIVAKYENCKVLDSTEIASLRYLVGSSVNSEEDRQKLLSTNDDITCPVCLSDVNYIRLGCNHTLCLKCSLMINDCPICRDKIYNRKILISI